MSREPGLVGTDRRVLCINHISEDCFESDSVIAVSMGLTKRRTQEAIPTIFDKPVQHSRTSSASASTSGSSLKKIREEEM